MPKTCINLLAAFLLMSLFGCGVHELLGEQVEAIAPTDPSIQIQQTNNIMIRVANKSNVEMKNIVIKYYSPDQNNSSQFHSQSEAYGNLAPGEVSDYHTVDASYRYAPMEATIAGKRIKLGVTDFVGEMPIPNGNYTYDLTYDSNALDTYDGLSGYLKDSQTTLDSEIDSALDEEIIQAILDEYSGEYGKDKVRWFDCVHQQTHREDRKGSSPAIVYANVVCIKRYFVPAQRGEVKLIEDMLRLPMRFELEQEGNSFSVTDYQFPRKAPLQEKDIKKIFSSRVIEEMERSEIREDTYNKLRLKSGREF